MASLQNQARDVERVPDLPARFGVAPDTLIPFGERPPARVVAALAHHGVRWHLWDDPTDVAIRFVISGVLHDHDPLELRYHLRVPTDQPAHFESAAGKSDTRIQDLGLGGACVVGGVFGEIDPEAGEVIDDLLDSVISRNRIKKRD